jgi:hypothetical protein
VNYIQLDVRMIYWRNIVNTVMNLRLPRSCEISTRTLIHEFSSLVVTEAVAGTDRKLGEVTHRTAVLSS